MIDGIRHIDSIAYSVRDDDHVPLHVPASFDRPYTEPDGGDKQVRIPKPPGVHLGISTIRSNSLLDVNLDEQQLGVEQAGILACDSPARDM